MCAIVIQGKWRKNILVILSKNNKVLSIDPLFRYILSDNGTTIIIDTSRYYLVTIIIYPITSLKFRQPNDFAHNNLIYC